MAGSWGHDDKVQEMRLGQKSKGKGPNEFCKETCTSYINSVEQKVLRTEKIRNRSLLREINLVTTNWWQSKHLGGCSNVQREDED